jgi:hypothetical protein
MAHCCWVASEIDPRNQARHAGSAISSRHPMRAREFVSENTQGMTISIPINITIPAGGGMPQVGTIAAPAGEDMPDSPVMVPPLQQQIELLKQQGGKESPVINQLINQDPHDPDDFANHEHTNDVGADSDDIRDDDESDLVLDLLKRRRARLEQQ